MIPTGINSPPVVRVIDPVIETLTIGPMIPSGSNSPPVARVIDPVIETLTTGPMIPLGINSPPVVRVIDPVIETLTIGPMIPSGSNSPPVARVISSQCFYHRVDNSSYWWTIIPEGIIGPVVSVSITGSITLRTKLYLVVAYM
jgi:hypothetical protein